MQASVEFFTGQNDFSNITVGVVGAGKVGGRLIGHLIESGGARVVAMDPVAEMRTEILAKYPDVVFVESIQDMLAQRPTVISPNAMGGFVTEDLVPDLTAAGVSLVCGGANNQLAEDSDALRLAERGIVYAPDFVINAGGVINVGDELDPGGYDASRVAKRVAAIEQTLDAIFKESASSGESTNAIALARARKRIETG